MGPEILSKLTSQCREEPFLDVSVEDKLAAMVSTAGAKKRNIDFQPYKGGRESGNVFRADLPESGRFILGVLGSWIIGTFVLHFFKAIFKSFGVAGFYGLKDHTWLDQVCDKFSDLEYDTMDKDMKTAMLILNPI